MQPVVGRDCDTKTRERCTREYHCRHCQHHFLCTSTRHLNATKLQPVGAWGERALSGWWWLNETSALEPVGQKSACRPEGVLSGWQLRNETSTIQPVGLKAGLQDDDSTRPQRYLKAEGEGCLREKDSQQVLDAVGQKGGCRNDDSITTALRCFRLSKTLRRYMCYVDSASGFA